MKSYHNVNLHLKKNTPQILGTGLSNLAQDSFQEEIYLHGYCLCLAFWFWVERGIHVSYWKGISALDKIMYHLFYSLHTIHKIEELVVQFTK